jgi:prepilin-type N-terminal cleavage/methylation domain-containing protein
VLRLGRHLRARVGAERGFTLIEVIVAMITGVLVVGAAFSVLEISLRQSVRQSDYAQATQHGRLAMTKVMDELHSTCLAENFTPVQKESTSTHLTVYDGYSEGTEFSGAATTLAGARKDDLYVENGKLYDKTALATSGTPGSLVFSAQPTTTILGEHVGAIESGGKTEAPAHYFRYFRYAPTSSTGTTTESTTLEEIKPTNAESAKGITEAEAKEVAAVQVSFKVLPSDGNETVGRAINMTSQATFALSAPSSEAKIEAVPCE